VGMAGLLAFTISLVPTLGGEFMPQLEEGNLWIRAFLSDGTLVMTSCGEAYMLAPWRWVDGATLVWEEDGRVIRGEVAEVGNSSMVLLVDPDGENRAVRFREARAPVSCPEERG